LFTKLDRVSFFPEFVRGLNKEQASEILGATLPVRSLTSGVYAEEETRRLSKAFDELFYSLAERRLDLLARENDGSQLAAIYEFPRELRKLRTLLVQFLVDLTRPSQLSVNPFLRGFYFSGVRPVIVDDVAVAAPQVQAPDLSSGAGATRIFSGAGFGGTPAASPAPGSTSRKVPQWVFLSQLFNDIIVNAGETARPSGAEISATPDAMPGETESIITIVVTARKTRGIPLRPTWARPRLCRIKFTPRAWNCGKGEPFSRGKS